ncbi:HRDC domain-containing protein [Paenibacillus sp. OSY-SE]|uniref:HRDC domain-containing protein n=1 Tax=Paenibacillus sp. OSY-SE TaxID=1196323 RepID=UPI0002EFB765|nr:HRDC domain-containing protein [Paenibacillus sp. OSY-SE]
MQVVWTARFDYQEGASPDGRKAKSKAKKEADAVRSQQGLVTVGEEEGKWIVLWEVDGGASEVWFEGSIWAEMRAALRGGLAQLLSSGYRMVLGFVPDTDIHERRMKERQEWVNCYAQLYAKEEVYEQLAKWRREMASRLKRAPYWVATNRMLRLVSAFLPHTLEELKQLPGFGEIKIQSFGDDIVEITKQYERSTTFPLEWVQAAITEQQFAQWIYSEWEAKQRDELTKLTERRKLLEGIQQGQTLLQLMELLRIDRRELIMRIETLEREGYQVETLVEAELASMPREERQAIDMAFVELGDEYLKPVYIKAFGEAALEQATASVQANYERIRLLRLLHRRQKHAPADRQVS